MAADKPLVTPSDVKTRIGSKTAVRYFDHNGDGLSDGPSLLSICADASSKVRGALGLVYDIDHFDPAIATELKRLALDAAIAMTARDHQGAVPRNWLELMEQVDRDLAQVRKGMSNLGTKEPPEPAANHGVRVTSGNPDDPNCIPRKMSDNWGDF